jgi:hypothetical protein
MHVEYTVVKLRGAKDMGDLARHVKAGAEVELVRESANPYDSNAVLVLAVVPIQGAPPVPVGYLAKGAALRGSLVGVPCHHGYGCPEVQGILGGVVMAKDSELRLNRDLEANLQAMLAPQMAEYNEELNKVLNAHKGGPVDELHQALVEVTEKHGFEPDVSELRKLAEQHAG